MMIELDASARERWDALPVGGTGLHVVEGVHRRPPTLSMELAGEAPCDRCASEDGPPPEWVALSEQKCETCGGTGRCSVHGRAYCGRRCPACLGSGRPLVQVTVPCKACDGDGYGPMWQGAARMRCHLMCDNGRVSIGYVTVEGQPVPIKSAVDGEAARQTFLSTRGRLWTWDGAEMTWHISPQIIDLPNPEQHVGTHWAVVYRIVEKL